MSAGHTHSHAPSEVYDDPSSRTARRITAVIAAVLAVAAIVLTAVTWPRDVEAPTGYQPFDVDLFNARVTEAEPVECPGPVTQEGAAEVEVQCLQLRFEIQEGPDEGETATLDYVVTPGAPDIDVGDEIVAGYSPNADPQFRYYFADFQRQTPLKVLGILFIVSVLLMARVGGFRALIGAGASLAVIALYLIPALLDGRDPLFVALVASGFIAVLALYLTHGINHRTNVAFLGTLAALGLTAVLATIFVAATHLTGLTDEDVTYLQLGNADIDVTGLLLAGIVIGALGVLDDVTVTQVSSVWEIHRADPSVPARQVYGSALRIGRDHISSTVNTLVLAYTGAALPLLLLFQQGQQPIGRILNREIVATEIVRALVGSIGLVASVPLTTALAVVVVGARRGGDKTGNEPADEPTEPVEVEPEPPPAPSPPPSWDDFGPAPSDF